MRESRHKRTLLKLIREQGSITAARAYGISNANQYLGEMRKAGILASQEVCKNGARFKEWFIVDNDKAQRILNAKG